jgi:putative SOS response-associated peptidase YedK
MCGRTVTVNNYNHCPTQNDLVDTANGKILAQWGLHFPHLVINARDDTKSPRFKQMRENRRCVVDAIGYYEWKTKDRSKQPYYITSAGGKVLKLAGMYDIDILGDGEISYVTMTCSASESLAGIHDRMPVILDENDVSEWLSPKKYSEIIHLVKPYEKLMFYPVSTFVNDVRNNGSECITPMNPKKNIQSKLDFRNGLLVTPEKKRPRLNLDRYSTNVEYETADDKSIEIKSNKPLGQQVNQDIIELSDKQKVVSASKANPIVKTPRKKLPRNQHPITKFFFPTKSS